MCKRKKELMKAMGKVFSKQWFFSTLITGNSNSTRLLDIYNIERIM